MTDLRTYQILAYLTHQPDKTREILGVPDYRRAGPIPGGRLLANLLGRVLTHLGRWLLSQAGEAERVEAAPDSWRRTAWTD